MYVQKFEADTLDEALKLIKRELGPDAVILKTQTNKGLKGAFKKNRVEITAAISEKNYINKSKVDNVLTDDQKETFYQSDASHISSQINKFDSGTPRQATGGGYGSLGLNRPVQSTKEPTAQQQAQAPRPKKAAPSSSSLDAFLSSSSPTPAPSISPEVENFALGAIESEAVVSEPTAAPIQERVEFQAPPVREEKVSEVAKAIEPTVDLSEYQRKIEELELKLFEMNKSLEKVSTPEPKGIYELRSTLRSLDISERYVQVLVKTALFELSREEQEDSDIVFEFALREMAKSVNTDMPMFSMVDSETQPTVTVFLSETSTGQTSTVQKISSLCENSLIIRFTDTGGTHTPRNFAEHVYGLEVKEASGPAEVVSFARAAIEEKRHVFIDYKNSSQELNSTKKFIDGLLRSFDKVEVLVSLSAIHTELYNRKIATRYRGIANGFVVGHLDLCLNFGSLFNLFEENQEIPVKFYGTGEVVPDDIESASVERILAGVFQLN